jgi:hypothetical protein
MDHVVQYAAPTTSTPRAVEDDTAGQVQVPVVHAIAPKHSSIMGNVVLIAQVRTESPCGGYRAVLYRALTNRTCSSVTM